MILRILDGAKGALDMGIGGCCKRGASSHARNSSRRSDGVERRGQPRARSGIVPEPVLQAAAVCRKSSFGKGPSRSRERSGFRRSRKYISWVRSCYETSAGVDAQPSAWLVRRSEGRKAANQPEKATTYFRKLAEMTKDADTDQVEISEARSSLMQ